ncbi:ABC transporter permease [Mycobacterium montefiorense]|uniref:Transport permease protein n=1 Tax=Mycobacterium montefiorense TaxID=154654 RepID=A0AA37PJE9_9MYCO|nr:ABC transporter permease [Mycobacterium montefiorense]GBG38499.1 transport permease protein [Mycobacterium montefiorense]GKU34327.1 putative doxorubicin resistance ABC transporter permease protein DrrC [Mycobacterium montefiorense]GKU38948.1 putative doxorubicin resistance ABC transporter permease protein DrrC [Mycobacterium montefiorense]GKU48017.1 putative doxorubicin resistance ABC transporter permease protein DrrC [Mycobacterium montefiorense]GKU49712.1 putative doxorubicin resistance A
MTSEAGARHSLLSQTWVQASRLLVRWRRDRPVLLGSIFFPVCLLLLYQAILGPQVHKVTGVESVYGLVPVCSVLSALFGALGNAVGITVDRQSRLLTRMWVLPVHRISALTGRLTAEIVRALIGTTVITALGVAMGLRFAHGWATALLYLLVPSIMVVGFTTVVTTAVVRSKGPSIMTWLAGGTVTLAFLNPGTTPIGMYPSWLQPFVRVQPISPPVEAMRSLALGGPLLVPLGMTLLWTVVLAAVFTPLAVRGYQRAAEAGG